MSRKPTKRTKIVKSLVTLLNNNLNSIDYSSDVNHNTNNKLVFWDEINEFPYISIVAGGENRQYLPANFKWGFLEVVFRIYVKDENAQEVLEEFLADIEELLDSNNNLLYDTETNETTELITILSITTDQGLFNPIGVGEMVIQIQYDL